MKSQQKVPFHQMNPIRKSHEFHHCIQGPREDVGHPDPCEERAQGYHGSSRDDKEIRRCERSIKIQMVWYMKKHRDWLTYVNI